MHFFEHLAKAPPALAAHDRMQATAPEKPVLARGLKLTRDRDSADQVEPESLEGGIVGPKVPIRSHGTVLQVPNIHSQHSRLK